MENALSNYDTPIHQVPEPFLFYVRELRGLPRDGPSILHYEWYIDVIPNNLKWIARAIVCFTFVNYKASLVILLPFYLMNDSDVNCYSLKHLLHIRSLFYICESWGKHLAASSILLDEWVIVDNPNSWIHLLLET